MAEAAMGQALMRLSGGGGAAFRQRWLEDHVLSDTVLGQAVPQLVRDFCPAYNVCTERVVAQWSGANRPC